MKRIIVSGMVAAAMLAGAGSNAFSGEAEDKAINARQSLMQLLSFNLGSLGAMVKGEMEYNSESASKYAADLKAVAALNQEGMWPQGTAMEDEGMKGKTWTKKVTWETYPEVTKKHDALVAATAKMAEAAGGGLDALKGAMGDVGASCKGCHENFRAPKD